MSTQKQILVVLGLLVFLPAAVASAIESQKGEASPVPGGATDVRLDQRSWIGQDLHLTGRSLISYQLTTGEHTLVFPDGFSMSIGANQFSSDTAVVWLESVTTEFRGRVSIDYNARVYLEGNVSVKESQIGKTTDLSQTIVEQGRSMVVRFSVSGEVFVTADKREIADPSALDLYKRASALAVPIRPEFVIQPGAVVPELPPEQVWPEKPGKELATLKPGKPVKKVVAPAEVKKPRFVYPVNIAPAGEVAPKIESAKAPDRTDIATVIGRFYLWQKQDEKGGLLELQADNAVVFYSGRELQVGKEQTGTEDVLAKGGVRAIYMSGDVVMTEGQRTIRADEMYYDFQRKKAIAVNAVMRNFDVGRGIPIYVRAAKLRQLAENKFAAENVTVTSSEFYRPQISLNASSVIITDTTTVDAQENKVSDSSYDAQMRDVRMKMGKQTVFYWPFMRSNLQRSDVPLKSVRIGRDSIWGTSVETRWYLSRMLGLREPKGVDSTLAVDYFGKRGFGMGVEIDYSREDYFGRLLGYVIRDSGEDRLGRNEIRRNLEPAQELRGRFSWVHRQFLPYNWQLTTGIGYASDENFLEGYYRGEFNVGAGEETYVHLKRLEDNWAVSLLGKGRINNFADELEELPSVEYHLTGQSLFDDKLTLYSDTQVSRLQQKTGEKHTTTISQEQFSFVSHRTEFDMPVKAGSFKILPFAAGTFGYDDRSGFTRTLVDGSKSGRFGEDSILVGEAGVRASTQYWKIYPNAKSRLWDLNQLRHVVKPQLNAVVYKETDSVVEQHDALNLALSQLLQTKRQAAGKQSTVDWMRLDMGVTWVGESSSASDSEPAPDQLIWSRPIAPLRVLSAPNIFSGDLTNNLHRFEIFGPRRSYFNTDYIWRVSDTMAVLSDMYCDMQSGTVEQFNVGFSRLVWPNLSYYIGSRYLRRIQILDEKGTNAVTFAVTYVLDPRYTLVFSQQYDFDYSANIQSEITLIRQYHRVCWGLTYNADASLNRHAIVLSIWPQGVPEFAVGHGRYMGLVGAEGH